MSEQNQTFVEKLMRTESCRIIASSFTDEGREESRRLVREEVASLQTQFSTIAAENSSR